MAYGAGDKPAKVVKRKPRVVKAPAGDIASSGGDYGTTEAKRGAKTKVVKRNTRAVYADQPVAQRKVILKKASGSTGATVRAEHQRRVVRNRELAASRALHDVPTDADLARAQAFNAAHPVKHDDGKGGLFATALNVTSKAAPGVAAAAFPAVTSALAGIDKLTGAKTVKTARKTVEHIPTDAAELAVTTPSSIAKLGSTAAHHPEKVPGMLAQPYEDLYHHPGKAITEHPVSTFLMVDPALKLPGRGLGRVARLAGKQTLERPAATLPGTALSEARTGSRDVVVRKIQARKDARSGPVRITDVGIKRRVDEFYGAAQRHVQRTTAAAVKQAKERGLQGDDFQNHVSGAVGAARQRIDERFGQEFGSTYQRTPEGVILKPKQADHGVLHDDAADAAAIADRVPFDATVKPVGDQYAVVPTVAVKRLNHHQGVGTTKALGAKLMRVSRRQFTQTVLPFSPKWLTGQAVEAGLRSLVMGAGPTSYLRASKLIGEMERQAPGSGHAFLERATPGGLVGRTASQEMSHATLADEFAGSALANVAHHLTNLGAKHGPKEVRGLFHAVTGFVFDTLNGRIIEGTTQKAMLGKALKDSPLMERSVVGLSDKAISDAAKGLHGTDAQVQLARAVQRAYGKYANFSPELRSLVQHWTPFIPWYLNVARFLTHTLPVDHPIHAALLADTDAATEEWRKAHHLSLHGEHVPSYLLGSAPVGNDQYVRLARYTPFGVGEDVSGSLAGLLLPQIDSAQMAMRGLDWTGKPLGGKRSADDVPQGERSIAAAVALIESMVPGVAQTHQVVKRTKQGTPLKQAVRKQFDPFMATGTPSSSSKPAPGFIRVPPITAKGSPVVRIKPIRIQPVE